jgi:hypothetical protein
MLRLGPLVLIAALAPGAAAATCQKAPPPAGPFGAKFIGEGAQPGEPCPVAGDTGNYREEVSRQHGEETRPADVPVGTDHDSVAQPPPLPPGRPVFPDARPAEHPASAVRAELPPSAAPAAVPGGPRWAWPGPESPEARRRRLAAEAPAREKPGDLGEDLRDAPAAVAPERYSLWAGLSKPLLLPASLAADAAPADAKALGERDYATHILSQSAVDMPAPSAPSAAAPAAAPSERKAVSVVLDLKATPGEWKPGAEALAQAAGFEPGPGEPVRFLGAARTKAVVSGTVLPDRMADLLTVSGVLKVESASASGAAPEPSGMTRVLVGLRLPTEGTPAEAVEKAAARLAESASFGFEKALALQQIPGSDQKVLVIAGRLPARGMAALLSDPEVVKVAPSPAEDLVRPLAARSLPAWKRALQSAVGERRIVFLAAVLSCLALWGPFLQGRSRRRRA